MTPEKGRANLESMEDVAIARKAILLYRRGIAGDKTLDVQLVSNEKYLPLPLSNNQTQEVRSGLNISLDDEHKYSANSVDPVIAENWVALLDGAEGEAKLATVHELAAPATEVLATESGTGNPMGQSAA